MAAKVDGVWQFSVMQTLDKLSKEDNLKLDTGITPKRKPHKKGNILTQIDTGTTHGTAGSWQGGTVFSHITTDNFIGITCSVLNSLWYDANYTLTGTTDDPTLADVYWDNANKKMQIRVNSTVFQSKPFRAIIFYRNKNF